MKTLLSLIAVAVAAVASSQTHAQMAEGPGKKIICPVTGGKVDIETATKKKMFTDYKGNRYFFCCGSCPTAFKKNPAKYASKPHIKTPKGK